MGLAEVARMGVALLICCKLSRCKGRSWPNANSQFKRSKRKYRAAKGMAEMQEEAHLTSTLGPSETGRRANHGQHMLLAARTWQP